MGATVKETNGGCTMGRLVDSLHPSALNGNDAIVISARTSRRLLKTLGPVRYNSMPPTKPSRYCTCLATDQLLLLSNSRHVQFPPNMVPLTLIALKPSASQLSGSALNRHKSAFSPSAMLTFPFCRQSRSKSFSDCTMILVLDLPVIH